MTRLIALPVYLAIILSVLAAQPKIIRVPQDHVTIQAAVNAAVNGDTVLVAEGTYSVNLMLSKKITLASLFLRDKDTSHISRTVLDGGSPRDPDSASVIMLLPGTDTSTVIQGFTIQNGRGTKVTLFSPAWIAVAGGGVVGMGGGATISHNLIRNNRCESATTGTGAAGIDLLGDPYGITGPSPWVVAHNRIVNNTSISTAGSTVGFAEGGAFDGAGHGKLIDNVITNNTVAGTKYGWGGGVLIYSLIGGTNVEMSNNLISANDASTRGGAVLFYVNTGSTMTTVCRNNLILQNTCTPGAAMYVNGGTHELTNNTIAQNAARYAFALWDAGGPIGFRMLNNLVWNPDLIVGEFYNEGLATGSHNLIRGGFAGTGNINADPLFFSNHPDSLGWFRSNSPAANAGSDTATIGGVLLSAPSKDYYGNNRFGPKPDIGAFEDGPWSAVEDGESAIPALCKLERNYPNPFNPQTLISYRVAGSGWWVRLAVYDILGREVAMLVNEDKPTGAYSVTWHAADMPSGVYFYKLTAGAFVETRKMVLMK